MAFCCAAAGAATIYMRDGSRVVGQVQHTGSGEVTVQTPQGVAHIPTSQIEHIDYAESAAPAAAPEPAPVPPRVRRRRVSLRREAAEPFAQMLSFHAGFAVPYGSLDYSPAGGVTQRNGDWGPFLGVQYLYQATPTWGWGLEFDWAHRSVDDSVDSLPNAETTAWGDSVFLLGLAKVRLLKTGWARPFIAAGAGVDRTSTHADATPNTGFVWGDTGTGETRRIIDDARWGAAVAARVGVDFIETPVHVFALELGWLHASNRSYNATFAGQGLGLVAARAPIDYLTFAGRWGFTFGEGSP